MLYSYLFRSKWAALFWAMMVLVGVYLRIPRESAGDERERAARSEQVNPWAKSTR